MAPMWPPIRPLFCHSSRFLRRIYAQTRKFLLSRDNGIRFSTRFLLILSPDHRPQSKTCHRTYHSLECRRYQAMSASLSASLSACNAPEEELQNRSHYPIVNISI